MAKKVLILGAAGQIPSIVIPKLLKETDVDMTLLARNAKSRLTASDPERETIVDGDINDTSKLTDVMKGQDIVFSDVPHAEAMSSVIKEMDQAGVKRLIVAGLLDVDDTVVGPFKKWNNDMIGSGYPDTKKAYQELLDSDVDYTYLKMTWLYNDKNNENYKVIPAGEPFKGTQVTREAIAKLIVSIIEDPSKYQREDIGVVEPGTENLSKPSFY
ncbi:NAD(P)H-binding protein [Fructilactobacillus fructivorans]|uniref:Putative oxidoreductase (Putative) n=1 Tax=Fructilactobacillus fructivorans TaxID=1614 RepID=A0A0C1Q3B9_9LACO|nr:NAD(P)H-binding protein [Fructilactobacillus fructivorans]KID42368.1 putative oxidoreductase (putative) [Fructilactobacillus fructivorans]MCT0151015.1 NAD-dependent epimerase/dehydratase family protein [Fructilactobacillus fructivorans]MCT2867427.1 NAD-dependent epimerase/dehydratase family protein [Fructilactobacillus fructivorans]MCT2869054.1 NAD-dependent epimerase/dehydratase family protein [Fructilactobacillus fructivorans]MCT2873226.1 NAD-dependent epimerase/dehydratase family protein